MSHIFPFQLRQSLVLEEPEVPNNISDNDDDGNNDNAFENELPDFEKNDFDMPQFTLDKDPVFFSHETVRKLQSKDHLNQIF